VVGVKGLSGPCIAQNSTALGPSRVVVLDVEPFPGSRLDPGFLGNFPAGGDSGCSQGGAFPADWAAGATPLDVTTMLLPVHKPG